MNVLRGPDGEVVVPDDDAPPPTLEDLEHGEHGEHLPSGPITYMARNGVPANLLMILIVAAGLFSAGQLVQEVFPEFSLDTIQITVPYPGATPDEVEESIVQKIEEQIEAVEGIKEITSTAAEGLGIVTVELELGASVSDALDDIKAEVDQIQTFPEAADRPAVAELTNRQSVMRLAVYGDASERTLKEIAYGIEDRLAQLPEVSYVAAAGIRPYEISIEIPSTTLRALGLTPREVANRVRDASLDLSAGSIETAAEEVRIRTIGQNYDQQDFEEIVLISRADGTTIRLGDIGTVVDGFEDSDLITRYNGQPSALVEVFRTSDEKVLEIVEAIQVALEGDIRPSLPAGVEIDIWENNATVLRGRMNLLIKNAIIGLSLVLLALTLFLDLRLAFWTAVGIAICFIGTFAVMLILGVSVNVLSLFAFILAIGIVVDDAIVVGENIFAEREAGRTDVRASVFGAHRIKAPVTFAVLTTVTAFVPLLLVPGVFGKIMVAIPIVVMSVLFLSLIETLFILPNHLSHLPPPHESATNPVTRFFEGVQKGVDARLQRFIEGPLDRAIAFAIRAPSVVISAAVGLIVVAIALVPAGILKVEFFPEVEGDVVTASLQMAEGTPAAITSTAVDRIQRASERVAARFEEDRPEELPDLLEATYSTVGAGAPGGGPDASTGASTLSANIGAVQVRLLEAEDRRISAKAFEEAWREEVGKIPGAEALTFASSIIGGGAAINLEMSHPDTERLAELADVVMEELQRFDGVFDVDSDQDAGLREIQLTLLPAARTLGLDLDDVARQVRGAFFGEQALRVQRGREDVRVYVRLPENERDAIADVEQYRIQTEFGGEVPLDQVATVAFGTSPTSINRKDSRRVLTVTADVDPQIVSAAQVSTALEEEILPELIARDPRLTWAFGGDQAEQGETNASLASGFLLAMIVVYALLAIPFGSYLQPLVVMAAIPFGIVGALAGHLILGLSVGLLSLFGIIGLSGVVVNDSLVMIDFINERVRAGMPYREAILDGAKRRFRPIMLTSLTTFLGVAPLVFERSLQAQFLIPMAAALAFGIVFATGILMVVVPALATVQYGFTEWRKERKATRGRGRGEATRLAGAPAGD